MIGAFLYVVKQFGNARALKFGLNLLFLYLLFEKSYFLELTSAETRSGSEKAANLKRGEFYLAEGLSSWSSLKGSS